MQMLAGVLSRTNRWTPCLLTEHDRAIGAILSAIRELMHPKAPVPKRRPIGFTADLEKRS